MSPKRKRSEELRRERPTISAARAVPVPFWKIQKILRHMVHREMIRSTPYHYTYQGTV
ncbi:MAG: hypothetical protein ACLFV2_07620 [Desulfurivibrionaceae bacterium]